MGNHDVKKVGLTVVSVSLTLEELDFLAAFLGHYYPDPNLPLSTSVSVDIQKKLADSRVAFGNVEKAWDINDHE